MRAVVCAILFLYSFNGFAQSNYPKEDVSEKLLYTSEKSYGLIIHTRGWGINYRVGKNLTAKRKLIYEGEFVTQRHPKEVRYSTDFKEGAKSFVYGKLNSVISLRPGVGIQNLIYGKETANSIEIRYTLMGGASFAFAKPVYLEVLVPSADPSFPVIRSEKYTPFKHDLNNIVGRSSFGRGLSQTKVYPGLYGKFALQFEYSTEDDYLKFIETGAVLDIYPKPVPQMAYNTNYPWMFSLYVSFNFGNKMF